ncbi:MAG: hypothetical protein ACOZQL_22740 [Myxococcota bacterium]
MSAPDPKDPRFRRFRGAAWVAYLVFAVGFSSLIIYSVFRSVLQMTPDTPPASGVSKSETECLEGARALFVELEQQRKNLAEAPVVRGADQTFLHFRVDWLQRKRNLEAQCGLEAREKARLAFASLDRAMDLYTTASVQFTGGVGPTVDELKQRLQP